MQPDGAGDEGAGAAAQPDSGCLSASRVEKLNDFYIENGLN
jgi:hypothetical protein